MAVKIIIDSASDFTKSQAEELGFVFMPMTITCQGKDYQDGVDLLPQDFYLLLQQSKELPKTSQITEYTYQEEIKKIIDGGDEVVVLTISSKLSSTYNNAKRACDSFTGKAFAVDTLSACLGEKLIALYAMELVKKGFSAEQIFKELEVKKSNVKVLAVIDTLEYLKKGGRLSGMAMVVGSLLQIKPIISVLDGEVKNIGKTMGLKKGFNQLIDMVNGLGGINFDYPYGIIYSGNDKTNLEKFLLNAKELWEQDTLEPFKSQLGSTIGTHIGPGAIGIAFFTK